MGVRSDIGAQNVLKILSGADKGRSHKTSQSLIRGSLVAGTTVLQKRITLPNNDSAGRFECRYLAICGILKGLTVAIMALPMTFPSNTISSHHGVTLPTARGLIDQGK